MYLRYASFGVKLFAGVAAWCLLTCLTTNLTVSGGGKGLGREAGGRRAVAGRPPSLGRRLPTASLDLSFAHHRVGM